VASGGQWRALYRGLSPNLVGNAVSWRLYFMWHDQIKQLVSQGKGEIGHGPPLNAGGYLLAAAAAGAATAVCTNPIWVVKTRMLATERGGQDAYSGLLEGLVRLTREEGIKGMYRGMTPALFGVSHGAVQFMAYEKLKNWRRRRNEHTSLGLSDGQLSNTETLLLSSTSKVIAVTLTYPYQVIRSRLQMHDAHTAFASATRGCGAIRSTICTGPWREALGQSCLSKPGT